jgi:putative oxidoreductase
LQVWAPPASNPSNKGKYAMLNKLTDNDSWLPLVGRALLAAIFLLAGINKIPGFAGTSQYMAAKGLPMVPVLLILTIIIEIGGAALIIAGYRTRLAALALIGFTIIITPIFHNFWAMQGMEAANNQIHFLKNLAVIGGLIMLAVHGPGRISLDERA